MTGDSIVVTSDADQVAKAERGSCCLGVGAFADCRRGLDASARHGRGAERGGDPGVGTPFLGICVGCQLMAERGWRR